MAAKKPGTEVINWQERLEKEANIAAEQEKNIGSGAFFSLKGGILSWNGEALLENKMAVVICDSVLENVFYEEEYDPDEPAPPTCYAFGRDEDTIAPFEKVVKDGNAQADQCDGCQFNEWGSADKGRGKACRNGRRLALISAGQFDKKTGEFELESNKALQTAALGFMKLSPTNIKAYATYVKQLSSIAKRPPWAMVTEISVVPDPKNQFRVIFEALQDVPDELLETVSARHDEAKASIEFPYADFDDEPEAASRGRSPKGRKAPAKKAAAKSRGRKY